jgi:hypothetical protein
VGTECSAWSVLRCTSSIFYAAGKLQSGLHCRHAESTGSDRCLAANVGTRAYVRSGTCIARTAVSERPASECADPYGDVQLAAGASIVGCTRVLPWCRCVPQRTLRARWCQARPIDAACGAAGSCAQAPRRCRVVSAAAVRRFRACAFRSQRGPDRLAAHSYGNLFALHARTHSPASACGAVRLRRSSDAAGGWTTAHTAGLGLAAHNAPCASAQVRTIAAAA